MAQTGKIVEVLFENAVETYEHQDTLVDLCSQIEPDPATLQNAGDVIWRPVQQHAPILNGWDLTGQEQDIIEETYPALLETPTNDLVEQRADMLRDMTFWERRGKQSGMQQATEQNKRIAERMATQASLYYEQSLASSTSGYDFIAQAQALMNERQSVKDDRCFLINDRDNLQFGSDLAGRQTVQGRPESTWKTGQIGNNIAEFDVYTGSFLPVLAGNAGATTTVTGDQSFVPEGGSVNTATGTVTNVDYRRADIPVASSAVFNVGDKVTISNAGTAVTALGRADKTDSGQDMTFTVVDAPDATTITVYPKPIALDDPALTATQAAYANIDTQILNGATVDVLQSYAGNQRTNLFWQKDAVEVISGTIPANLFQEFSGKKVISSTLSNGQEMYMVYDGTIEDMNFKFRIFMWYGITIAKPQDVGVAVTVA